MAVFVSVLEGEDASSATPILATRDARVVAAVARTISECLGVSSTPPRVLRLAEKETRRQGAAGGSDSSANPSPQRGG
jgi:hypothetical protein